jgi:hypothetical protein
MTSISSTPSVNKGKTQSASTKNPSAPSVVQTVIPFGVKPPKRHIITNYGNLTAEVQELLLVKYPLGWRNHVMKVNKGNNDFFYAITLDTPDVDYLIKVDVNIDSRQKLEEDRTIYGGYGDEDEDETDELPSKEDEKIADDSPDEG